MEANWPPLLVIHGDADAVVSPHNGQAAAQVWAHAAGARASAAQRLQLYFESVLDAGAPIAIAIGGRDVRDPESSRALYYSAKAGDIVTLASRRQVAQKEVSMPYVDRFPKKNQLAVLARSSAARP